MAKSGADQGRPQLVISLVDDDPLRARGEARELLGHVSEVDPTASMRVPATGPTRSTDKGGDAIGLISVLLSAGSLAATCVQVWLAKVPQRTIIVTRPDGATLHITGREAREDEARLDRFLAGGSTPTVPEDAGGSDGTPSLGEAPAAG